VSLLDGTPRRVRPEMFYRAVHGGGKVVGLASESGLRVADCDRTHA